MNRMISLALAACLATAGCAPKQPPQQAADASTVVKPTCKRTVMATGSHIMDPNDCSSGQASSMSSASMERAMRQSNPGGIRGQ